jgi:hypothetical protein
VQVLSVASGVPTSSLSTVLAALAEAMVQSPHLEFVLDFVQAICTVHGGAIQSLAASQVQAPLRALQRVVGQVHDQLSSASDSNMYTLQYLSQATVEKAEEVPVE